MTGSEFVDTYRRLGLRAWEAAALGLAEQDRLVERPFVPLRVVDEELGEAVLQVRSDVLAVGTPEDNVRLPLTPVAAQDVLNLTGELLPTPWLVYQIWRSTQLRLQPIAMVPNQGASLDQYAAHSEKIDGQIQAAGIEPVAQPSVSGIKKHVVVSNAYKPGKVLIFGWYRPSPPAPDVFDDRSAMTNLERQPIQPLSNVHGDLYVDYSHGIQGIHPEATVNGQTMRTEDLYRHPTLSRFVSREGPVRVPRYLSKVPVARGVVPVGSTSPSRRRIAVVMVPTIPNAAELGYAMLAGRNRAG